jgi:hypothetical protein
MCLWLYICIYWVKQLLQKLLGFHYIFRLLFFMVLFPSIQIILFCTCIGKKPYDLMKLLPVTSKPRPWWNYYQSEWCFYNTIKRLTSCNVDGSKNCRNFLLYADPSSLTTDTVRSYGFLPIHVQNNIIWIDGNRTGLDVTGNNFIMALV